MERTPSNKRNKKKCEEKNNHDDVGNLLRTSNKQCNCADKFTELKNLLISWRHEHVEQLNKIQNSLTVMQGEISEIKKTNSEIEKSLDFLYEKHNDLNIKFASLEHKSSSHELRIKELEYALEEQTRKSVLNVLEIRNVPHKEKETQTELLNIVNTVFTEISAEVSTSEIQDIRRLPSKTEKKTILVTLNSVILKRKILMSAKAYNTKNKKNKLNSSIVNSDSPSEPLYVDEHLTPKAKRLYYLGRQLSKSGEFKYCWTSNGRVLLRKEDGSKTVMITEESQIENLKVNNAQA